jgi:hypothetical protein
VRANSNSSRLAQVMSSGIDLTIQWPIRDSGVDRAGLLILTQGQPLSGIDRPMIGNFRQNLEVLLLDLR